MRIRLAIPDRYIDHGVLNAALEAVTRANKSMLEAGDVPPISEAINRGRVHWRPEPKGQGEHFDLSSVVLGRGWGDCDDLAPAYAAELRATGADPAARAVVVRSGPKRWHAKVLRSDGAFEDPSKAAGMGKRGGVVGAVQSMLVEPGRGAIALRRWGPRGYAARCDIPWSGAAICGHHIAGHWLDAVHGAIEGACVVGHEAGSNPDARARAMAIEALLHGNHPDDVREALHGAGYSHVIDQFGELLAEGQPDDVGFLPLAATLAPSVLPMAQGILSKFMGGGAAAPAAAAAAPAGGGGGGGMPSGGGPGGAILPIIVKF